MWVGRWANGARRSASTRRLIWEVRGWLDQIVISATALTIALVATVSSSGTSDDQHVQVPEGSLVQPATLMWDGDTYRALAYAEPGALVVAGRVNYADPAFKTVAAHGGSVLVYLDPVIDNAYGRYHQLLLEPSRCGPQVEPWPGRPRANSWGMLNDFRPGSVLQRKLRCVLQLMVEENPHMAGWFIDDVGSRSWFPGFDWDAWSPQMQRDYRRGAIAISRTVREVADEHGLVFLVNGTWTGGPLAARGGGYPDPARDGNALADGGFVENHDESADFFTPYACSRQWASMSSVTQGSAINFATTRTWDGLASYVRSRCFAYVNKHDAYDFAPPWTGFHDLGLPSGRDD